MATCEKTIAELKDEVLNSALGMVASRSSPDGATRRAKFSTLYQEAVHKVSVERAKQDHDK